MILEPLSFSDLAVCDVEAGRLRYSPRLVNPSKRTKQRRSWPWNRHRLHREIVVVLGVRGRSVDVGWGSLWGFDMF